MFQGSISWLLKYKSSGWIIIHWIWINLYSWFFPPATLSFAPILIFAFVLFGAVMVVTHHSIKHYQSSNKFSPFPIFFATNRIHESKLASTHLSLFITSTCLITILTLLFLSLIVTLAISVSSSSWQQPGGPIHQSTTQVSACADISTG